MAGRVVYGNSFSSNGWPMVDTGSCTWVNVPGTSVTLQIQNGWPLAILRAFAADFNAYVEPLRDADSACWTATNSVSTSNHLSGTAMDLNWDSHPFQVPDAGFDSAKIAAVRDILDFFEGTVFWGNDWSNPKDAMHLQLSSLANGGDINTYNNPAVGDFIARKIRADGFSTFRRDNTPVPPPVTQPLSRADGYAVKIIQEGQRRGITPRGIEIALATGLVESNLTIYANAKVPASMDIPHDAVGSDGYSVGIFQQQVRDTGNGWWWGDAATCMDPTSSAGLFYSRLVTKDYNGPNSPGSYAQAVQSSAFPDRYDQRFNDAVGIYNRLATTTTPPVQGDDMALVPQNEWNQVRDIVLAQVTSQSPFRRPGETATVHWLQMLRAMDGNTHGPRTIILAAHGHPGSIQDLRFVADLDPNQYPDRADDKNLATAILADLATEDGRQKRIDQAVAQITGGMVTSAQAIPPTVYAAPASTDGAKIGNFVDSTTALPSVDQKTLDVLQAALEVRTA